MTTFNLRNARLRPGEQFRDVLEVDLEPLELGGQRYVPVPERPEAALTLTQTSSGLVLELELGGRASSARACAAWRTRGSTSRVAAREYQASEPGRVGRADDALRRGRPASTSPAWAHDAVALALPDKILCREDCAGLCPVCGKDLNREPHEHEGEEADPRWAALGP